jgi:3-mercaptopropionate dioxygenase
MLSDMITTLARDLNKLTDLVDGVRTAVAAHAGWADTARLVAT